ncbi:MAG TPA: type IV pilus assembly protein PilM [Terriglobia bacterium]|nr:type IV pilus assembly protein PilM [Terriglobia bacterium]
MLGLSLNKRKGLVGLDIGSSSVKAVELKKTRSGFELANLGMDTLGPDTVVDGAIMDAFSVSSAIEKIFKENKISSTNVATSISGSSVMVKKISVAAANEAELEAAIPYEAQQQLTADVADVNLSFQVLGPSTTPNSLDVMLVAAKREKVSNYTNVLSQAGKTPVVVDVDAFALQNAFEAGYEPSPGETIALVNIGASIMNINIVRAGVPLFTRDISMGGKQYTEALQRALDLGYEDAEKLKMGGEVASAAPEALQVKASQLALVSEQLLREVQKTLDFFHQTSSPDPIDRVYLAGGTARVEGLAALLEQELKIPVEVLNPFRKVAVSISRFDADYIAAIAPRMVVAVGLALRSFDAA